MKQSINSQQAKIIHDAIDLVMVDKDRRSCTGFFELTPKCRRVVRVTRKRNQGRNFESLVVSICEPNYRERDFLALCRQAETNPNRYWIRIMPKKREAK